MDSVKKQLRFFKVLIVILVLVVAAQFSFLFNVFAPSKSSDNGHLRKVRVLEEPRKVVDPAVSTLINIFFK
jgi:hypothetical protein